MRARVIATVVMAVLALGLSAGVGKAAVPTLDAVAATKPPVLDGRVAGDPAWSGAARAGDFKVLGTGAAASAATEVRVLYDHQALYLGFVCQLPPGAAIQAQQRPRDKDVYRDECVEVFLAPNEAHPERYLHFIVNALGSRQDERGRDPSWDASWRAATSRTAGAWQAELAIPWAQLPLSAATGKTWRVNFCRFCPAAEENSSWAPCEKGFHEPQHFGELRGVAVDFAPVVATQLAEKVKGVEQEAESLAAVEGSSRPARRTRLLGRRALRQAGKLRAQLSAGGRLDLVVVEQSLAKVQQTLAAARKLSARVAMAEAARRLTGDEGWAVTVESPMRKIPAYESYGGEPAREAVVELARNEYEGVQLVVVSLGDRLEDVRVQVGELRDGQGHRLPDDSLSIRRIDYVEVKERSGRAVLKPGLLPDPLVPYQPREVPPGGLMPLLLTVHARAGQAPGLYSGSVTIQPRGRKPWPLKLTVRVWPFALPRTSRLRTCFNLIPSFLPRFYDVWDGKTPPGWTFGRWVGADVKGRANYFGEAEYDHGVTSEHPHTGKHCAWIKCTSWHRGDFEEPRAAYMTPVELAPGKYTFSFAYRTDSEKTKVDFGIGGVTWQGVPASTQWREVRYQFEQAKPGKVYFYLRLLSLGQVWFDSVSLRDAAGKELAPNADFDHVGRATTGELARSFRENMLAHRASDMNVAAPEVKVVGDEVQIDWGRFDRDMEHYISEGLNAFNVHWARIRGGWGKVAELDESSRPARVSAEILRQTQEHLAQKGWLDLAYIYCIDEPGRKFFPQVKRIFAFVHHHAPRLKRLLTYGYGGSRPIEPGHPAYADLAGYVDIHVPHSDCFEPVYLDQRRKAGDEIWAYVCISAQRPYLNIWGIDFPGTDPRVLFWQLHRYRITGFLYWAVDYWTKDPWKDPLTYPGGNADGSLLYPGKTGPVDSLRWEATRDGIEDYDYLALARELAARLRKAGKATLASRLEELARVDDVTRSWTEYTEDPAVVMAHRHELGLALSEAWEALGEQ
ncbi:MAG: DUF4091 domain-containing protein [Armatimonadetes bacterium]|nr:DUF4091 domain-containing protein [Armatimonadota bacterium]